MERAWAAPPNRPPAGSWILDGLAGVYGAALAIRRPTPRRAPIPVVSVGSLWVGGAGKTPLAAELARIAAAEGLRPAVILRGYGGRRHRGVLRLPSDPREWDPRTYGDEACLHAARGTSAVYVAPDRLEASRRAAADGCRVVILDDGMQHRRLARDLEVATLPADRPLGNGRLLPRGPLREGESALGRADLLVLAHGPIEGGAASLRGRLPSLGVGVPIHSWSGRLTLRALRGGGAVVEGERVTALCGIARPGSFRDALVRCGYSVAQLACFPDHHPYTQADVERVRTEAARASVAWIVTTEKDAIRLRGLKIPDDPEFAVAELSMVWNEPEATDTIRRLLNSVTRAS